MKTRRYRSAYKAGKAAGYAEGYKQGLHDGNPFIKIAEAAHEMVKTISDRMTDPEFIEACKEEKIMYDEERRRELIEDDRYADYLDREAEAIEDDREDERNEINRRWKT